MANERPKALNTIGLQLEGATIKAVHLAFHRGRTLLKDLYSLEINKDTSGEPNSLLKFTEQGRALSQQLKTHLSYSAISSSETLIRSLFVQLKKEKDISTVVDFQAEPILPFSLEDSVIDWVKVNQTEEGSNLTIFAVQKEHIQRHLSEWKQFDIDPEGISAVPAAIVSFATYFLPDEESYYIVHVGYKNTTCALVYNQKLIAAQFISKGLNELIEALKKDDIVTDDQAIDFLTNFSFQSIDNTSGLSSALAQLRIEIMKLFFGLAKQLKGEELSKVLITGEGGAIQNFSQWLASELKKEPLEITLKEEFPSDTTTLLRYDVPIGLALSGLPKNQFQINFRKNEYSYAHPWKRLIRPIGTYLVASILIAWGAYFSGQASIRYKEDQLKEKFGSLLAIMNKSYSQFENEYEGLSPEGTPEPIESLSLEGLSDRLNFLDQEIEKAPQPIALLPNTPRVSDVLAWLAMHPNVVLNDAETNDRKSLVQIQHFNYSLVKRPEEKKRNNRYQAKVEIEFISPTPKLAREFHDALIEDNSFVDTKGEVKWSSNRGLYRTSFYLVDKTFYPTNLNTES